MTKLNKIQKEIWERDLENEYLEEILHIYNSLRNVKRYEELVIILEAIQDGAISRWKDLQREKRKKRKKK